MRIPFFAQSNPADCGCAPACLRMALGYYKVDATPEKLYELAQAIGTVHYTLPWGVCLAASALGLHATFVSRNPDQLLDTSRDDIAKITGLPIARIRGIELSQIERCRDNRKIRLLRWQDSSTSVPRALVDSARAVVIPTLWWGRQPHNVVLLEFTDALIRYHDPNEPAGAPREMSTRKFEARWGDARTDQDLLLVSDTPLGPIVGAVSA